MAVLAEMYSVILRTPSIEAKYSGGLEAYRSACPNATFCSDGEVCRIGFMTQTDAQAFLDSLKDWGLTIEYGDAAVVDERQGLLQPCDWLEFGRMKTIPAAALIGSQQRVFVAPPGWSPRTTKHLTEEELRRYYECLKVEDGVETHRNRITGEIIYLGRVW